MCRYANSPYYPKYYPILPQIIQHYPKYYANIADTALFLTPWPHTTLHWCTQETFLLLPHSYIFTFLQFWNKVFFTNVCSTLLKNLHSIIYCLFPVCPPVYLLWIPCISPVCMSMMTSAVDFPLVYSARLLNPRFLDKYSWTRMQFSLQLVWNVIFIIFSQNLSQLGYIGMESFHIGMWKLLLAREGLGFSGATWISHGGRAGATAKATGMFLW